MDHPARRDRLRKALKNTGAEALLVTSAPNVTYLTGFTGGDSYLLVLATGEVMISDGRYITQLEEECPGLEQLIRRPGVKLIDITVRGVRSSRIGRMAIEAHSMTVAFWDELAGKLPKLEILPTTGLVEELRQCKDKEEIAEIRQAIECAESAFSAFRANLRLEMTEKEAADELDHQLRLRGATEASFPTIVAVGARGALPHANPTSHRLNEGDTILVDWGACGRLYKSDLTRVLVAGKILPKLQRVYEVVLRAQTQAIAAIRPGVLGKEVDQVARGVIAEAGFGPRFKHGLGHGLGLEVHESPLMNATCEVALKPGMVVTVEPGIYLPGWGGVRIEDDVLVTRSGHEVLTSLSKELGEMILT
jgi:Xaa-Pro aminopeptidase